MNATMIKQVVLEFNVDPAEEERAYVSSYRIGWWMYACGAAEKMCLCEAMRAGWRASRNADALMRAAGVRGGEGAEKIVPNRPATLGTAANL